VMRFWVRRGVDGFRIDVLWHLIKDDQFRDNPEDRDARADEPPHKRLIPLYTADRPEVQEVVAELRCVADEFEQRVLIGEIYLPFERLIAYYGQDLRGVHLPFNFSLLQTPWQARAVARLIDQYESALPPGGWPNWVLGNHDRPRVASRVGDKQARIAAMLLFTLRGTPTVYYGDEIGMRQVSIGADQVQDPVEKNLPGHSLGRDGARTPMQWDATDNAGFSFRSPWLPVGDDYRLRNLANQRRDVSSIYHLHRRLIDLRHARRALSDGSYTPIAAAGDLLLFVREYGDDRVLVALNFGGEPISLNVAPWRLRGAILLSCLGDREGETIGDRLDLQANDGLIIEVGTDFEIPSSSS
jgi:alpha-glucosidase